MSAIIYKIWSEKGDKIYVGSTGKKYLCMRKADHLFHYKNQKGKRCSSYDLFDEYGVENCIFEQIDEAKSEEERFEKETYWINELHTVNIQRKARWSEEDEKQYFADRFQRLKTEDPEWYKARNRRSYELQKDMLS
jgi:hypothetical protein